MNCWNCWNNLEIQHMDLRSSQIFSDLLRSQRSRRALKSASSSSVSTARTKSVRPPVVSTAALPRRHPRHPGLADTAVAAPRICGPGSLENSHTKKIGKKPGEFLENETYETLEAIPSHSEPIISATVVLDCLSLLPAKDVQSKSCRCTETRHECNL